MMIVQGIFPALTTPFAADGSVSLAGVTDNIRLYNHTRLAGYVVLGSTGESVMLSRDEGESILAAVKEAASPDKLLIAGTGVESTAETIARCKRAAALGYQVALVKTPYYYRAFYNSTSYLHHYRAVADASPIPILLYSVPIFTGVTLETAEILALADHPNVAGIKDSSGSLQRIGEVVSNAPKGFSVLTGGASIIYPALAVGARGAILALASALPEKCVELFGLVGQNRHEQARGLQHEIVNASKAIVSEGGIAGVKYAMELRGYQGGAPRLPLLPLKDDKKHRIEAVISQLHLAAARV